MIEFFAAMVIAAAANGVVVETYGPTDPVAAVCENRVPVMSNLDETKVQYYTCKL